MSETFLKMLICYRSLLSLADNSRIYATSFLINRKSQNTKPVTSLTIVEPDGKAPIEHLLNNCLERIFGRETAKAFQRRNLLPGEETQAVTGYLFHGYVAFSYNYDLTKGRYFRLNVGSQDMEIDQYGLFEIMKRMKIQTQ